MIAGKWNPKIKPPMNTQSATLDVTVDGGAITGTLTDANGTVEITDGKMTDKATFKALMKTLFGVMSFDFTLEVNGDEVSGKAKIMMGTMPVTGTQAQVTTYFLSQKRSCVNRSSAFGVKTGLFKSAHPVLHDSLYLNQSGLPTNLSLVS